MARLPAAAVGAISSSLGPGRQRGRNCARAASASIASWESLAYPVAAGRGAGIAEVRVAEVERRTRESAKLAMVDFILFKNGLEIRWDRCL